MAKITTLTLNCFDISFFTRSTRKERIRRLITAIINLHPDNICLQEITFFDTTDFVVEALKSAGYHVFAIKTPLVTANGLVTASRFPFATKKFVPFNDQGRFFATDLIERMNRKGFHLTEIKIKDKQSLTLINTHLHCPIGDCNSVVPSSVSTNQYRQICEECLPLKNLLLTGDFNITPVNRLYYEIVTNFHDPLRNSKKITLTSQNTHRKYLPKLDARIDYAFVDSELKNKTRTKTVFHEPVKFSNGGMYNLSDHFGLWTEISL